MKMLNRDKVRVSVLIDAACDESYNEGLKEGLSVAKTIFEWYSTNDNYIVPMSTETLEKWSADAIEELERKLKNG
jgi:hypothetical protein